MTEKKVQKPRARGKAEGDSEAKRPTVKDRARAIVADAKGYDKETRRVIRHALETQDGYLKELVRRAEAGESILQVSDADDVLDLVQVEKEQGQAARALFRLLDMQRLPPFVSEALYMILNHAAAVKGVAIGDDSARGYSIKAVTNLFAVTSGYQRGLSFVPAPRDFAELLASAVNHPDCPGEVYNAIGDCDCLQIRRWDTPAALRLALGTREQIEAQSPRADGLAGLVAAVLKHPDTPADLYTAMRREIATMTEPDAVNEDPAVLRVALAVHKAEQEGGEE